jgi:hypothetical protein
MSRENVEFETNGHGKAKNGGIIKNRICRARNGRDKEWVLKKKKRK